MAWRWTLCWLALLPAAAGITHRLAEQRSIAAVQWRASPQECSKEQRELAAELKTMCSNLLVRAKRMPEKSQPRLAVKGIADELCKRHQKLNATTSTAEELKAEKKELANLREAYVKELEAMINDIE